MSERDDMLNSDPDFILLKRFDYSLAKMQQRYPDGAPDSVIAQALGITESSVEPRYQDIVQKLRSHLGA